MRRQELRELLRLRNDLAFINQRKLSQEMALFNPSLSAKLADRDMNTGKHRITLIDGGTGSAKSITNSGITVIGGVIPATFGNNGFNTIDSKPN